MSRFSVFVHQTFGTGAPNETAADIIVAHIPDTGTLGIVKEVASDVVAVMEGTGLSGDEKKKLATLAINFALTAAHVSIPASLVSFIIEEAVLLLKGGKSSAPPPPPPDPTSIEYATKDEAIAHVTATDPLVIEKPNGKFIVWPQIGPFPGTQVFP